MRFRMLYFNYERKQLLGVQVPGEHLIIAVNESLMALRQDYQEQGKVPPGNKGN
jgi:hypothetical protein